MIYTMNGRRKEGFQNDMFWVGGDPYSVFLSLMILGFSSTSIGGLLSSAGIALLLHIYISGSEVKPSILLHFILRPRVL